MRSAQTRVWAGRMVREQRVTHIMVVSDSPDQTLEVNRRLESRLEEIGGTVLPFPSHGCGGRWPGPAPGHRMDLTPAKGP